MSVIAEPLLDKTAIIERAALRIYAASYELGITGMTLELSRSFAKATLNSLKQEMRRVDDKVAYSLRQSGG